MSRATMKVYSILHVLLPMRRKKILGQALEQPGTSVMDSWWSIVYLNVFLLKYSVCQTVP